MTYLDESDMNAINSYHRSMDRAEAEHNRIVTTAMNMTLISAFEYLKYQYSEYVSIPLWYDSNAYTSSNSQSNLAVSIPLWYDSNTLFILRIYVNFS